MVDELRRLTDAPAWVSFTCADESHTASGDDIAVAAMAVASRVIAVGLNCTAPRLVEPLLRSLRSADLDLPFVVYPNHGRAWDAVHECWLGDGDGDLAARVPGWWRQGARLIGGCCGIGPDGVRALVAAREALAVAPQ